MEEYGPFATVAAVLLSCMLSVIFSVRWARRQTLNDTKHDIEETFAVVKAELKNEYEGTIRKSNIGPTPDKVRYHGPA